MGSTQATLSFKKRIAISLLVLTGLAGDATAQGRPPTYPDPLNAPSVQPPDQRNFSSLGVNAALRVSVAELQVVVDALAGPGLLEVLPAAVLPPGAPPGIAGTAALSVLAQFEMMIERGDDSAREILGPVSSLLLFTNVRNRATGATQSAYLVEYHSDAESLNELFGGTPVATQADFEWEVEQEDGRKKVKVEVEGEDGFKVKMKVRVPDALGTRVRNNPVPVPVIYLGAGPGGPYPTVQFAAQFDQFTTPLLAATDFSGIAIGDTFSMPGGDVHVLFVRPFGFRGIEQAFKLD